MGIPRTMKAALLVAFCALAAVSLSMPIADDAASIKHLSEDVVSKIEARTQEEVAAIKSQSSNELAKKLLPDVKASQTAAEKIENVDAQRQWYIATDVASQLKEAEKEAHSLMAEKRMTIDQQKADKKALADFKDKHSRMLGESGIADDARIKAAKWKEGEALAKAAATANTISPEQQIQLNQVEQDEERMLAHATQDGKKIDQAGFALNKWYNAHEHKGNQKLYRKSEAEKEETELGDALTPEQQKIQDTAIASIKKVQEEANEAIAAMAGNSDSDSGSDFPAPLVEKQAAPSDHSYQKMGADVNEALNEVKKQASADAQAAAKDAQMLTSQINK